MRIPPPNSLISAQFTQNITDLRQNISRTAEEVTTGRYSDLAAHLSGRVGTAMLSQKALDDIGFQREQLGQREARLDVTQRSLTLIHDRTLGIDISMQQALGSGNLANQGLAARDAKAALADVFWRSMSVSVSAISSPAMPRPPSRYRARMICSPTFASWPTRRLTPLRLRQR
jgi:flagellar hook-associated protein 3 FlgL